MTRCRTEVAVLAIEVIVAAAVLVGIALVASRPDIGGVDDPDTDHADIGLPTDRLLRSDDIPRLKFRVVAGWRGAVRGYRFSDVDATLAKVEEALRAAEGRSAVPRAASGAPSLPPVE
jgi:hypothetical protein